MGARLFLLGPLSSLMGEARSNGRRDTMSSGTLACAQCGNSREVILTDDQDRLVRFEEYRAAVELAGFTMLCSDCSTNQYHDAEFHMLSPAGTEAIAGAIKAITDGPVLTPADAVLAISDAQDLVVSGGHTEAYDSEVRWGCYRKIAAAWPECTYERMRKAWLEDAGA